MKIVEVSKTVIYDFDAETRTKLEELGFERQLLCDSYVMYKHADFPEISLNVYSGHYQINLVALYIDEEYLFALELRMLALRELIKKVEGVLK